MMKKALGSSADRSRQLQEEQLQLVKEQKSKKKIGNLHLLDNQDFLVEN
jgi:hypothetical protein